MEIITSRKNRLIKKTRSYLQRKNRERDRRCLVEGYRLFVEAYTAKASIDFVFIEEGLIETDRGKDVVDICQRENINYYFTTREVMEYLAATKTPQGVIAVAATTEARNSFVPEDTSSMIILDSVNDPGNFGTIARTALAAGFKYIVLLEKTVDPFNPKSIRASMGSVFDLILIRVDRGVDYLKSLSSAGYHVLAADPNGTYSFWEINYTQNKIALVVGNEAHGINNIYREIVTDTIQIPLSNGVESLNVAVAAGIIMFESVKQRKLFSREGGR